MTYKRSTVLILSILSIIVCLVYIEYRRIFSVRGNSDFTEPIWVEIPNGAVAKDIAEKLVENNILRSSLEFRILSRITGMDKKFRAGRFRYQKSLSTWDIMESLTKGGSFDILLTIPEGFTIFHIAGAVQKRFEIDSLDFVKACFDKKIIDSLGVQAPSLEGYLFPETYNIPKTATARDIVKIMFTEFKRRWKPDYTAQANAMHWNMNMVLTMASIIEAEAQVKEEQVIISSVYHNRLRIDMMMQADPTTIYGLRKFDKPLTRADLNDTSAYNTYRVFGLPPGPICNPGESAIRAALAPANTNFLYFVAKNDGRHMFSYTLKQHHAAIHLIRGKD